MLSRRLVQTQTSFCDPFDVLVTHIWIFDLRIRRTFHVPLFGSRGSALITFRVPLFQMVHENEAQNGQHLNVCSFLFDSLPPPR